MQQCSTSTLRQLVGSIGYILRMLPRLTRVGSGVSGRGRVRAVRASLLIVADLSRDRGWRLQPGDGGPDEGLAYPRNAIAVEGRRCRRSERLLGGDSSTKDG